MQKSGTVVKFDSATGRGSIFCQSLSGRVQFQAASVRDTEKLESGDLVQFELGHIDGAGQAVQVSLIAKGARAASSIQASAPRAASLASSTGNAFVRHDDKEQCRACSKFMVPGLTMVHGIPERSFCPFCGAVHRDFRVAEKPGVVKEVGHAVAGAALGSLLASFISF